MLTVSFARHCRIHLTQQLGLEPIGGFLYRHSSMRRRVRRRNVLFDALSFILARIHILVQLLIEANY
ncbi:hypothetical protein [Mycetohabitans endofungorum]|uniref:hypothetical protein n=1 Tax=Mycetohabitans endofungorum TaxID=417203 RepID=UPI002B05EC5E|nr:hypothetical protein [Mycetohabitans endofungorum]